MKLLLDENLSPAHAGTLRHLGHDAVSVADLGLAGASDDAVQAEATRAGRVLVTLDGDFANVLRHPPGATPGVLRLRVHPATEAAIDAALRWAIPQIEGIDLKGKLVVVDGSRIRARG